MSWLNYHHLLYFWTVARAGSLAAASERLSLAPATLSAQIRTLEGNLGLRLFDRGGRRLTLTEAGRAALRYADEIFVLGDEMMDLLAGREAGQKQFVVGVTDVLPKPLAFRFLLPALQLDGVRAVCYEGKQNELLARLAIHEIDLVLSDFPLGAELSLSAFNHLLGRSAVSIVGAPSLANKHRKGFPASLHQAPFLLPTENTALRRAMNQWFAGHKVRPKVVAEFEDTELLKEYGEAGGGLFAIPTVSEAHTMQHYKCRLAGRLEDVHVQYFAISTERRIHNAAVTAIVESAKNGIFG